MAVKATYVAVSGLTDSSGQISMTRSFTSDQPVVGRVRKTSAQPYYQTADLIGVIDSATGLAVVAELLPDE